MCTVTWLQENQRLELFTNRDERRTRPPAEPPRRFVAAGGRHYLAPRDPEGGGTWVAVNDRGVVLCLLNHYQAAEPAVGQELVSRGQVVLEAIGAEDLAAALQRAAGLPLARLRGFRLLGLAPGAEPQLLSWDGRTLVCARGSEVTLPLVSSSVSPREAEVSRRAVLDELTRAAGGLTAEVLAAFHRSELPAPGPLAVSMSRPDAWTVSHTRIVVEPQGATLRYQAGRPSADGPAVTVALARSR